MKILVIALSILSMAAPGLAQADPPNGFAAKERHTDKRPRMSASEAAARAQARHKGGKILSVTPVRGGNAYRVKILNRHGQVRVVTIDANH